MEEAIRLNKYLADAGVCSRREADKMIEEGKVLVDGAVAAMGTKVMPGQKVICDGKAVGDKEEPVFLIVNKPKGIVCTTSDKDHAPNIVDFINYPKRVYPVGRLDKDSEGLLLMTNEGDIVNKILRGGNDHEKEYAVAVNKPVTEEFLKQMRAGVYIEDLDVTTKPCRAWQTGSHTFHIVLTQGLNRQIRRMCRALDYHVMNLKRLRIMNIKLGHLERGQYRELFPDEVESLRKMLEGSTNLPKSEQMKLEAGMKAAEKEVREPEKKTARPERNDGMGRKESSMCSGNNSQKRPARTENAGKTAAQKKPEAFKEGNKVFRTVPKFYPRPDEAEVTKKESSEN